MLLTDIWEALEYTNQEPPVHLIMRPVAAFFGYKFEETSSPASAPHKKRSSDSEVASVMGMFGKPKPSKHLPKHILNSPALKKMFEEMKD